MWIQDYLDIQMVQSRLTIFENAMQAHRIGEELFADIVTAEVILNERIIEPVHVSGIDAIKEYYVQLDQKIRDNGDYIGDKLSTCQNIQIYDTGSKATGVWYTYTVHVLAGACGYEQPPYPFVLSIGKYENTFVKTSQGWKFEKIIWSPVWELEEYVTNIGPDGQHRPNTEDWPRPFELYEHMTVEEDADPEDISFCEAVLNVRNLGGQMAEFWNTGAYNKILSLFVKNENASFYRQGMPKPICGIDNLSTIFTRYEKMAQSLKATDVVLTTTGVIQPQADGKTVEATWTLFHLEPKEVSNGKVIFANKTGRWNITFIDVDGQWKILTMEWLDFATMTDISGRRV